MRQVRAIALSGFLVLALAACDESPNVTVTGDVGKDAKEEPDTVVGGEVDLVTPDEAVFPDEIALPETTGPEPVEPDEIGWADEDGMFLPDEEIEPDCVGTCEGKQCGDDDGCGKKCIVEMCDDGDKCTLDDACSDQGECKGTPKPCDDGVFCNGAELCNPDTGECGAGASIVDDGIDCTVDSCDENAKAVTHEPDDAACDDTEVCTDDSCDPGAGCKNEPNEEACDDDDICTVGDHCSDGGCQAGADPLPCEDSEVCTTDSCDPKVEGGCVHSPVVKGTKCDDFDDCTENDKCKSDGTCAGTLIPVCGNGVCEKCEGWKPGCDPEESGCCQVDCGSCGDGLCGNNECVAGCAAIPGKKDCIKDCGTVCGNSVCEGGESPTLCPADCATKCGDGVCYGTETPQNCPGECKGDCGNGFCNEAQGETPWTCLKDCETVCGNDKCEPGENPQACGEDCGSCGDGICANDEYDEEGPLCQFDCLKPCGDGKCEAPETETTCKVDCGGCGDGLCGKTESWTTCPLDCPGTCPNGTCDGTETKDNCPVDCSCLPKCDGKVCGPDGCGQGGICGVCPEGQTCNEATGQCKT